MNLISEMVLMRCITFIIIVSLLLANELNFMLSLNWRCELYPIMKLICNDNREIVLVGTCIEFFVLA